MTKQKNPPAYLSNYILWEELLLNQLTVHISPGQEMDYNLLK